MTDLDLPTLLSLLGGAVDERVRARLRGAGHATLRTPHGYLIQRLLDAPRTASELAEELHVTQQAVSKLAAELEDAGYVSRIPDPADARRRPLRLTARALDAVEEARRARGDLAMSFIEGLDPVDADATLRVLEHALAVLGLDAAAADRRVPMPVEPEHGSSD